MENRNIIKLLSVLLLAVSTVLFTGCDDDSESNNGQVELLSFGPAGVKHGEEIIFVGQNLSKVTSINFAPNVEVPSSAFTVSTNNQIKLVVPDAVESGKVMLKTTDGDIESKTVFNLEVPVTITAVTAEAKPGTNITITGDKLNWIETITFPNDMLIEKTAFVSQTLTELVVAVPMEAQTGFLTFTSGGTEPLKFESENALVVKGPVATALTPSAVRHAADLTLSGTDLDLVTKITFPGGTSVLKTAFKSQSETSLVVAVPTNATNGKLTLTAPSGVTTQTTPGITIVLPNVTAFSPASTMDHDPGVLLTMTGTDLDLVESLTFPGVVTQVKLFEAQSPTEIKVTIPAGAEGGTVVITTIHKYTLPITLPFGDQLTLATVIFDDAIKAPLGAGGGWGGVTTDVNSTENPRAGTKSIKVTFAGSWGGGAQFGNWSFSGQTVSTAGASFYAFSIYGGPGTSGKKINVNVAGKQVQVPFEEGKWTDVQIPLTDLNSPTGIGEIWFQDTGWSGVVFIDHIGLK
jgi:hypothetical protein